MIYFDPYASGYQLMLNLEKPITEAYDLARELMPELPEDVIVWLDNRPVDTGTGVTGFAKARGVLALIVDGTFPDKAVGSAARTGDSRG